MIPGSLARRYARALFGLAPNPAQRDKFAKDMDGLAELVRQKDTQGTPLLTVLATERFPLEQRTKVLEAIARRVSPDPMVLKFLRHVLAKGRIDGLPEMARAYRKMADDAAGRVAAEIVSATPLAPDALARIKKALEDATGKQIIATTAVDPELIGGVVTKVGGYVVDGSVRASLASLASTLKGA